MNWWDWLLGAVLIGGIIFGVWVMKKAWNDRDGGVRRLTAGHLTPRTATR